MKVRSHGIQSELDRKGIQILLVGMSQRVKVEGYFSEWRPVTSGVPQGSLLNPVYLSSVLTVNMVSKCSDDTRFGGIMDSENQLEKVGQEMAGGIYSEKYNVLHFVKTNQANGRALEIVVEHKDLKVLTWVDEG